MIDEDRLEAFGSAVAEARAAVRTDDPAQARAEVRARLLASARSHRPRRWVRAVVPAVLAVAAAIVLAVLWPRPLTFEVGTERAPGVVGAWLATPSGQSQALRFSDGSAIDLHPDTRARVAQLQGTGAQVVLEAGAALVSIEPRSEARWQVDAGPYRVDVTGTRFDVGWDPEPGVFALDLYEGAVIVRGPGIEDGRAVVAGESLRIGGGEVGVAIASAAAVTDRVAMPQTATETPPAEAAIVAPEQDLTDATAPTSARPRARATGRTVAPATEDPEHDWRALAERASYREALAAAEARGFDDLCESLSARDLLRLADVARFARRPERATAALEATRRRFPGSDTAAMAAFERGRMAFVRDGYGDAAKWFAVYLDERPDGSIAREATGRLMESQHEAGRGGDAARTAARYLARWPEGPDRDLAERLRAGK